MSKEFQIRDGNLIASFDLENEDGDIDFCKLLKVSHGVADEIGMFVDYVATNKIIKDQSKKIADLETKLAESEKKAYSRGHSQRDIANEIKLNALREDVANKEKRIVELKQQLAESEKERHEEWKTGKEWKWEWQKVNQKLEKSEQDKISFALEQLEKVKELLNTDFESTISWIAPYEDGEYLNSMTYNHNNTIKIIDNQIKQLKELK